jgi:hypothetical protein
MAVALLFACGQGSSSELETSSGLDSDVFTRTVVTLKPDGNHVVQTQRITRAEQRADVARRMAALEGSATPSGRPADVGSLINDPTCASASMWMFDDVNLTGNELCFYGYGTVDLNRYFDLTRRATFTWTYALHSFLAGADNGAFYNFGSVGTRDCDGGSCTLRFRPREQVDNTKQWGESYYDTLLLVWPSPP